MEAHTPPLMTSLVKMLKKISTWLSQEAEVGVKRIVRRRLLAAHSFTALPLTPHTFSADPRRWQSHTLSCHLILSFRTEGQMSEMLTVTEVVRHFAEYLNRVAYRR